MAISVLTIGLVISPLCTGELQPCMISVDSAWRRESSREYIRSLVDEYSLDLPSAQLKSLNRKLEQEVAVEGYESTTGVAYSYDAALRRFVGVRFWTMPDEDAFKDFVRRLAARRENAEVIGKRTVRISANPTSPMTRSRDLFAAYSDGLCVFGGEAAHRVRMRELSKWVKSARGMYSFVSIRPRNVPDEFVQAFLDAVEKSATSGLQARDGEDPPAARVREYVGREYVYLLRQSVKDTIELTAWSRLPIEADSKFHANLDLTIRPRSPTSRLLAGVEIARSYRLPRTDIPVHAHATLNTGLPEKFGPMLRSAAARFQDRGALGTCLAAMAGNVQGDSMTVELLLRGKATPELMLSVAGRPPENPQGKAGSTRFGLADIVATGRPRVAGLPQPEFLKLSGTSLADGEFGLSTSANHVLVSGPLPMKAASPPPVVELKREPRNVPFFHAAIDLDSLSRLRLGDKPATDFLHRAIEQWKLASRQEASLSQVAGFSPAEQASMWTVLKIPNQLTGRYQALTPDTSRGDWTATATVRVTAKGVSGHFRMGRDLHRLMRARELLAASRTVPR